MIKRKRDRESYDEVKGEKREQWGAKDKEILKKKYEKRR